MPKDTKECIKKEALKMLSTHGIDGTNLRDLAANLGLTKSAIYKHFGSKEELCTCVLKEMEEYYNKAFNRNINPADIPNDTKELINMTLKQVNFTVSDKQIVMCRKILNMEQYHNQEIAALSNNHFYDGLNNYYAKLFRKLIDNRVLKEYDPKIMAIEYVSPITLAIHAIDRDPKRKKQEMNKIAKHLELFCNIYGR